MSGEQKDTSNDVIWILIVVAALAVGIYWWIGDLIVESYLTLKLRQLKIIDSIYSTPQFAEVIKVIETTPIKDWKFTNVLEFGGFISRIFNVLYVAILGYFTYIVWSKNPSKRFKRVLDMNGLKQSEKDLWPYIYPVINVDFMAHSFEEGPYAMALKPYDFAVKNGLLSDERNLSSLDRVKTEKLFVTQLDRLSTGGYEKLRKHEKALAAICIAKGLGKKDEVEKVVAELARSAATVGLKKMPDLSCVKPLYKYLETPEAKDLLKRHAYVYTLMIGLVGFARITGVFPSSMLIWLKPRDRTLWYVVNGVGRQVAYVEVAAIFGHFKAEEVMKHKVHIPFTKKAFDGLAHALLEVKLAEKRFLD